MGVNICLTLLPDGVTTRDCHLNPGPSAPESRTLTTWLPSHASRTKRYCSFTQYGLVLTTTSKPTFLQWSLFNYLSYY